MDLYIVLGVARTASLDDIKRAYRRLARKYHPDINPGDRAAATQFREIAEAYETLSDPDRRRRYDADGAVQVADEPSVYGFQGFDFSVSVSGSAASTFGDLFADVIQARFDTARPQAPARGADLHQALTIGFEEAMRGSTRHLTITREEHCGLCHGIGQIAGSEVRCTHCQGTGAVRSARGHMVFTKPCAQCGGTGVRRDSRCPRCQGRQVEGRSENVAIPLPPGIPDGAMLRVAHKGHAGANGGALGDLLVTVRVEAHPVFRRDGDDLHVTVPIGIHEAALGGRVEVPSLEGSARVRIPPGTRSGQRFRVRERGVPARDGSRGDLVVEVQLALPSQLDERSKELLREFGRLNAGERLRGDRNAQEGPARSVSGT